MPAMPFRILLPIDIPRLTALDKLSKFHKIPRNVLIREGIDRLIEELKDKKSIWE